MIACIFSQIILRYLLKTKELRLHFDLTSVNIENVIENALMLIKNNSNREIINNIVDVILCFIYPLGCHDSIKLCVLRKSIYER